MDVQTSPAALQGVRVVEMGQLIAGPFCGKTLAALHGAIGVLTALYHRKVNGGQGQVIDVALHEAVFNVMESLVPEYSAFGAVRDPADNAGRVAQWSQSDFQAVADVMPALQVRIWSF